MHTTDRSLHTTKLLWVFLIWLILWIVWTRIFSWLTSSSESASSSFWVQSYEEDQTMPEKWVIVDREIHDGTCHNLEEMTSCISEWTAYTECAKLSESERCKAFVKELITQNGILPSNLPQGNVSVKADVVVEDNNVFNWFWVWASKRSWVTTSNKTVTTDKVCSLPFDYKVGSHNYTSECVQQKCCDFCIDKKDEAYCKDNCVSTSCLSAFQKNDKNMFKLVK